jgi:hypothetical protein
MQIGTCNKSLKALYKCTVDQNAQKKLLVPTNSRSIETGEAIISFSEEEFTIIDETKVKTEGPDPK